MDKNFTPITNFHEIDDRTLYNMLTKCEIYFKKRVTFCVNNYLTVDFLGNYYIHYQTELQIDDELRRYKPFAYGRIIAFVPDVVIEKDIRYKPDIEKIFNQINESKKTMIKFDTDAEKIIKNIHIQFMSYGKLNGTLILDNFEFAPHEYIPGEVVFVVDTINSSDNKPFIIRQGVISNIFYEPVADSKNKIVSTKIYYQVSFEKDTLNIKSIYDNVFETEESAVHYISDKLRDYIKYDY